MSEILIRAAESSDADAIQEIFNQPIAQANTLQLPWRSVEQRRDWLSRVAAEGHVLVAEIDGRVVGQLGLHVQTAPRRRDVGSFGMAVHDAFHGRGVGSALMRAMIELADNWLGLRRIELEVYTDNAPGVRLYEKFGFVVEGTGRAWARRHGKPVDVFYMARLKA